MVDTARRWQVTALVTAAAGLGGGALMIGHQTTVAVEPIDLGVTVGAVPTPDEDRRVPRDPVGPRAEAEIVPPGIIEVDGGRTPAPEPTASEPATEPTGEPDGSADAPAADSPVSVDSATSVDSD
jgi:hypothetical protein